jgi:hypothetical protein
MASDPEENGEAGIAILFKKREKSDRIDSNFCSFDDDGFHRRGRCTTGHG